MHFDTPNLGEAEAKKVAEAVLAGEVATNAPSVRRFEAAMAARLGVPRVLATSSGTAALHLALHLLGIGPGDEVIVPALTYVATVNPIRYVGATPVIVDVEPDTWTLCPEACARAITEKTRAIVPVHLYGTPAPLDRLSDLAAEHQLILIEDAAESLGATFAGRPTGTLGTIGFLSFNGNKTITTGGGGLFVSTDEHLVARAAHVAVQARDRRGDYQHTEIGFNARMTGLSAALGLAQLERLEMFLDLKRRFDALYRAVLERLPSCRFQACPEGARSSVWLTAMTLEDHPIAQLRAALEEKSVPTRRVFTPLHLLKPYRTCEGGPRPVAEAIHERGLVLPGSTLASEGEIQNAAETLWALLNQ